MSTLSRPSLDGSVCTKSQNQILIETRQFLRWHSVISAPRHPAAPSPVILADYRSMFTGYTNCLALARRVCGEWHSTEHLPGEEEYPTEWANSTVAFRKFVSRDLVPGFEFFLSGTSGDDAETSDSSRRASDPNKRLKTTNTSEDAIKAEHGIGERTGQRKRSSTSNPNHASPQMLNHAIHAPLQCQTEVAGTFGDEPATNCKTTRMSSRSSRQHATTRTPQVPFRHKVSVSPFRPPGIAQRDGVSLQPRPMGHISPRLDTKKRCRTRPASTPPSLSQRSGQHHRPPSRPARHSHHAANSAAPPSSLTIDGPPTIRNLTEGLPYDEYPESWVLYHLVLNIARRLRRHMVDMDPVSEAGIRAERILDQWGVGSHPVGDEPMQMTQAMGIIMAWCQWLPDREDVRHWSVSDDVDSLFLLALGMMG